jgi:FkbM family methyltransferase
MTKTIKRMIRSVLNRFGYDIGRVAPRGPTGGAANALQRRMYTMRHTMEDVVRHVVGLGFAPATVVDVGVAYGTDCLYELFPDAHHLLVEPMAEFRSYLERICAAHNAEYVLAAAGAAPGTLPIYYSSDMTGASVARPEQMANCTVRTVPVVTLDGLCAQRKLPGPYLIKVDTQGSELAVLDGAASILGETELVILEVSLFHFTPETPDCFDVFEYMKRRGFVVYDVFGGHNRPLDGARAQFDAAFVKEDGMFRHSHAWIKPEQASQMPPPEKPAAG